MKYKFKYKKGFFWKSVTVTGHQTIKEMDRMDLIKEDGSIISLSQWSKYDLKLGQDWVLAVKKTMEKEAGQSIGLEVSSG
jgi:hypothetical protein